VHAEWLTAALQTMSVAALRERGPFLSELAAVCVVFLSDDSLVRVSRALETLLCLTQVRRMHAIPLDSSPNSGRSSSSLVSHRPSQKDWKWNRCDASGAEELYSQLRFRDFHQHNNPISDPFRPCLLRGQ
jgi:hypothetical protein